MSLFPDVPLSTDAHLGASRPLSAPRSHLVSKAPTGEPLDAATERQQLLARVEVLERRMARMEDYIQAHTWYPRWMRLKVWWRSLPAWMARYPDLMNKRRRR